MDVLHVGLLYGGATLLAMFSGMPIAFALGLKLIFIVLAFAGFATLALSACSGNKAPTEERAGAAGEVVISKNQLLLYKALLQ